MIILNFIIVSKREKVWPYRRYFEPGWCYVAGSGLVSAHRAHGQGSAWPQVAQLWPATGWRSRQHRCTTFVDIESDLLSEDVCSEGQARRFWRRAAVINVIKGDVIVNRGSSFSYFVGANIPGTQLEEVSLVWDWHSWRREGRWRAILGTVLG